MDDQAEELKGRPRKGWAGPPMTRSSRLRADRPRQGDLKQAGEKVKGAFSNQRRAPQASVAGAWSSSGPGAIQTRADDLTFQYSSRTCLAVGSCRHLAGSAVQER